MQGNRTKRWMITLTLIITMILNLTLSVESNKLLQCGKVYDGLTEGRVDMKVQTSTTTIAANWVGFGDDVLFYEWAVVSDKVRLPLPSSSSDVNSNSNSDSNVDGCYEEMRIRPDVMHWEGVKRATSAIKTKLSLSMGVTYYVLVRATFRTGHQLTAISDGVLLIPSSSFKSSLDLPSPNNNINNINNNNNNNNNINENIKNKGKNNSSREERGEGEGGEDVTSYPNFCSSFTSSSDHAICTIENENRCRQTRQSVGDYLDQIYGRAVFQTVNLMSETSSTLFRFPQQQSSSDLHYDDEDDDDEHQSPSWILAPILGFIFLLFLIALCLVFLISFCCCFCGKRRGKEEKKEIGEIKDGKEGKDYGNRGAVGTADTTTNTKVEFPDTNIRRLSVDHNDEGDVTEEVKGTRRKHPIATTSSSSFRDYRNQS